MGIPAFHWWRTVFFLIPAIGLYTIVAGTVSLTSTLFRGSRLAHRCMQWWSWGILATTGVTVSPSGIERVPPKRSYVFVSNHSSFYDIPVIYWHVPFDMRIIAKASLGAFPFIGWHLRRAGHVLVQRDNPGASAFAQVKTLMAGGHSLIVFPEGTRSADGNVGRFRSGIFQLAIEAGLPVVPIAVTGTHHVMPKNQLTTSPGHATLEVFDPIETEGLSRDDAKALAKRVEDIIAGAVARTTQGAPAC
ncbi:MAG: 1-acyl-sn-glycerol-3-phosphate acyltransferase [Acidobacteria bacterium]|nr:1-acyl-sn-glycerol-3-phosphate acyltransferase [Acidobacteriota bacterium]